MKLIEVENIEKAYDGEGEATHALRGVSFVIEKGEFVAIMGASGSGKSTLLHILGFLDRHSKGTYRFQQKTIDDYPKTEIALVRNEKMGFVFQSFNLLGRSSVLENVKLPFLYSKVKKSEWEERAIKAINAVGLSHRLHHSTSKLSGGEKQRTAIARALVMNPEVIFADEPTGNLDSQSGGAIMDIFKKLHAEEGHTIILITHEKAKALFAHRIITLEDGRIKSDEKT
jgi:putative ABC transport system ATP-binding protein